jgi:hypothetical protein
MAWSVSGIFQEWINMVYQVSGTGYTGLDSDTVNVALFNTTTTPDKTAVVANTGFNTGVWTTTNEVTDATNWVSGGRPLASKTFTFPTAGTFMFDAADLSGGGNVTLAGVFGCFVYDNTITAGSVAKQGTSFHYFGGSQGVTAGSFTVAWHVNGLQRGVV